MGNRGQARISKGINMLYKKIKDLMIAFTGEQIGSGVETPVSSPPNSSGDNSTLLQMLFDLARHREYILYPRRSNVIPFYFLNTFTVVGNSTSNAMILSDTKGNTNMSGDGYIYEFGLFSDSPDITNMGLWSFKRNASPVVDYSGISSLLSVASPPIKARVVLEFAVGDQITYTVQNTGAADIHCVIMARGVVNKNY